MLILVEVVMLSPSRSKALYGMGCEKSLGFGCRDSVGVNVALEVR